MRDLVRARADVLDDRKRMQQRLSAVLVRHGRIWRGGNTWTLAHRAWVAQQVFGEPALNRVVSTYRGGLAAREAELAAVEAELATWAKAPLLATTVARLGAYRGIATLTGMTLAAEVVDWRGVRDRTRVHGFLRADPQRVLQRRTQPPGSDHQGRPGGGADRADRGGVGLAAPAGDRGHAVPSSGRRRRRNPGSLMDGAATTARQVQEDDRARQAPGGRRGGPGPGAGWVRVGGDDQLTQSLGAHPAPLPRPVVYRDARRGRNDPRECFERPDARGKCGAPSCEQPACELDTRI